MINEGGKYRLLDGGKTLPSSKNDPNFKYYVTSCLSKKRFATRDEAVRFAMHFNCKQNGYYCQFCKGYHLTTSHVSPGRGNSNAFKIMDKKGHVFKQRKQRGHGKRRNKKPLE